MALSEITDVYYDPSKKWGMGPYPRDGKVHITARRSKRELVVLGDQSGKKIADSVRHQADLCTRLTVGCGRNQPLATCRALIWTHEVPP